MDLEKKNKLKGACPHRVSWTVSIVIYMIGSNRELQEMNG